MKTLLIVGAGEYGHVVRELAIGIGQEKFASEFDEFIVAIGNPAFRRQCVAKLSGTYTLATIVHPLAYVSPEASIAAGSVIEPGCVVYRNVTIGEACLINAGEVVQPLNPQLFPVKIILATDKSQIGVFI